MSIHPPWASPDAPGWSCPFQPTNFPWTLRAYRRRNTPKRKRESWWLRKGLAGTSDETQVDRRLIALWASRIVTTIVIFTIFDFPGARPVGIGETLRRIIGKSLIMVLKRDITWAADVYQVCADHAPIWLWTCHTCLVYKVFAYLGTETVLLVDADNAFNRLNCAVALHNIQYTCPPLATILTNRYQAPCIPPVCNWRDGTYLRRRYYPRMPLIHSNVCFECRALHQQMPKRAI